MDREIIYILAVVNLTLGFVLVYGCKIRTGGEKGENKICLRQQTADDQESKSFSAFRKQLVTSDIGPHDPLYIYMRKPLRGIPPEGLICGLRRPPGRLRLFF